MGESPSPSHGVNNLSAETVRLNVIPGTKKMKLNHQVILSPNPFAPLAEIEDMNTDSVSHDPIEKVDIPPPIFVHNTTNINLAIKEFRTFEPTTFKYVSLQNKVKLNFMTIDGYRKAIKFLETKSAEYHTFQLKNERAFRVVIRGLHPTSDVNIIKDELSTLGFEATQILPVLHPVTKSPLSMFFVDLKPSTKNSEIYSLNRLYHAVVKVEPPRPRRTVIQCVKCQEFGHSKNYCHKKERCVKCDGAHSTQMCPKPSSTPPTCTNCRGPHTANYRGCPVHVQLQKSKAPIITRIQSTQRTPDEERPKYPEKTTPTYGTYAQAVNSIPNPSSDNSGTVMAQLLQKIDQLLSLIQPLVSTLTQILPKLLKP